MQQHYTPYVFPLEVPTWPAVSSGSVTITDASSAMWADFGPSTVSPAALHSVPFALEVPSIVVKEEPTIAPQEAVPSSGPSSPEGTPTHLSPRSSWSGASSPTPAPVNNAEAMDLLMRLIAWPAGGARSIHAKKRPRSGEHEYSKEKHLQTEKRRREDMSEAIDTIHRIMPESRMDKKVTKVDILQDAALYFAKLQAVALALVEENAQLRARCAQHQIPTDIALNC